jgi:opacity protein-like surface antigen
MRIVLCLHLAVLGGALSFFLFAPAAFAQTPVAAVPVPPLAETLVGDAKQDYDAGKSRFEAGDYAGALSKFQSASRTSGDPRLFWNQAVCERAMQHYARAIALVHRYLDSHSPLIGPDAASSAQDFLSAAEARTARIDVQSSEPGAVVSVDGEAQGPLPLGAETRIDFGSHRLAVSKDGFVEYATSLTVETTADVHVTAVLVPIAPPEGRLVVRAGSRDAIAVDGVPVAVGAWRGALTQGPHTVRVTEPSSNPFESEVVIEEHQTRSLDVTLRPARRSGGVPAWLWIAGGTVLAAGAVTAGYFAFRSSEPQSATLPQGSAGNVPLP